MTKAEHILKLYDGKRTTAEIGAIVGCDPAYVRVVARQRKGTSRSEIDNRYLHSALGQKTRAEWRKSAGPAYAARWLTVEATGDKPKANRAARKAYRDARRQGLSVADAKKAAHRARSKTIYRTANNEAVLATYAAVRRAQDKQIF